MTTVYDIGLHTFTTGRDSGYSMVVSGSPLLFADSFTAGLEAERLNEGKQPVRVMAGLRGDTGETALPYFVRTRTALEAEDYRQHRAEEIQKEIDRMRADEKADRKRHREAREARQDRERQAAALRGEV